MSVRQGILALLAEEPMHCYHLRQRFEERTGGTWPLNIGQAYTTVQRLVRDGLVELVPDDATFPGDDVPPSDDGASPPEGVAPPPRDHASPSGDLASPADDGAREAARGRLATRSRSPQHVERYRLTAAGRDEVAAWWATPVVRGTPARDELAIKIALAVTAPGVDVRAVVQAQRTETMRALRDYTRLAAEQGPDLTWALVLDNLVFATEAEVRWLDHVEARIARAESGATGRSPSMDAGSQGGPASTGAVSGGAR